MLDPNTNTGREHRCFLAANAEQLCKININDNKIPLNIKGRAPQTKNLSSATAPEKWKAVQIEKIEKLVLEMTRL